MNIFKKNGGFTLVELIVVIAILAILAGVAVPAYSGYINNANKAADDAKIEAVETAMSAALAMYGKGEADADEYFTVKFNEDTKTLTVDAINPAPSTKPAHFDEITAKLDTFYGADVSISLSYYNQLSDGATKVPDVYGVAPSAAS